MGLRACVNVASLPLQILLQENPAWKGTPVAVTRDERPQSPILSLNRAAREKGLVVGMRYANALSLVPGLRARAVEPQRVGAAREAIVRCLALFTPDIEPCPFDEDAFWASADGLRSLFGTEAKWSQDLRRALTSAGFHATVVVGFTRFGTYAVARSRPGSLVFATRDNEQALLGRSVIDILPLPQKTKNTLKKLEIRTVARFAALPAGEVARRFGEEAGVLWQAIRSDDPLPVQPVVLREACSTKRRLDAPVTDLDLLMPCIDELLEIEIAHAGDARSVIAGLTLVLRTEDGDVTTDLVRPATPTLKAPVLRRLILLRIAARTFGAGVEDIEIFSALATPSRTQEELFTVRGRDLKAGARAFAALRARFGNDAVCVAELRDSWLPERSFVWSPVSAPCLPSRAPVRGSCVVRRIHEKPRPTAASASRDHPFIVSGSWWGKESADMPFLREYSFARDGREIAWTYRDALTGGAWIQGVVD